MTIQRIEAKLDALINVFGFDVMVGGISHGETIKVVLQMAKEIYRHQKNQ